MADLPTLLHDEYYTMSIPTSTSSDALSPSPIAQYVQQAAALVGLSIHPDHLSGVVDNMTRIQAIAALVTEFPLPDEVEAAPVFDPDPLNPSEISALDSCLD